MKRTFKFDVAISAADFDALGAAELQRRLTHRLRHPVFASVASAATPRSTAAALTAHHAFEKDARVVVVLFQRLWGATPSTEADATAIRARITKTGHRSVCVVRLDASPLPVWLRAAAGGAGSGAAKGKPIALESDQVIDRIIAAVDTAGGAPYPDTPERVAARQAIEDERARLRTAFLGSQRATTLVGRELDALSTAVTRHCATTGVLPEGLVPAVRRTPERYTMQIGPVGLSFSWIRGRSNSIADGQLLVIEWAGQLGGGEHHATGAAHHASVEPQAAMPAFEHVLQPHATGPEDWQWRRTDLDLCSYTTRDLAAQCVTSVLRRLPTPRADAPKEGKTA